jgi:hypothetical protein
MTASLVIREVRRRAACATMMRSIASPRLAHRRPGHLGEWKVAEAQTDVATQGLKNNARRLANAARLEEIFELQRNHR